LRSTGSPTTRFFPRERTWILAALAVSAIMTKTWELISIDNSKLTLERLMLLLTTKMTTGEAKKDRAWLNPKTLVS